MEKGPPQSTSASARATCGIGESGRVHGQIKNLEGGRSKEGLLPEKGVPAATLKASSGCVTHFVKSHQPPLRRRTALCQRLPQDCEEEIVLSHFFLIGLHRKGNLIVSRTGNAVETPLTFDVLPGTMVSEKSVPIKNTDCEKQHCTVSSP